MLFHFIIKVYALYSRLQTLTSLFCMCTHSRNVCESEFFHGTYGGLLLVVSELDSKLRGLGQRPGLVNLLCSLAKVFSLRVTLTIQENKWVLANFQESIMKCRGLTLWWIGIPSRGGNSNTPSHLKKSRKAVGSFGLSTDFKFFLYLNLRNYISGDTI